MSKISSNKNSNPGFAADFFAFAKQAGPNCRLRFAPTPSGYLHIGNALNFTLNWLVARLNGGKILLRIDDLDADRKRPEYLQDIFDSLHWLGLDWDEGPGLVPGINPVDDFELNWSQHHRLAQYAQLLDQLRAKDLLFACQKSRRDLAPFEGKYPAAFRQQACQLDDPHVAWRIKSDLPDMPDFIVRRRDGLPAYQIASVADDLHFQISHAIRGEDLEASTAAQRFIAELIPITGFLSVSFLHHPLILDDAGNKLSKSAGASALIALRKEGHGPGQVFSRLSQLLQLPAVDNAAALLSAVKSIW